MFTKGQKAPHPFLKGHVPWNKGKPHMIGKNNPSWKGGFPKCKKCGILLKKHRSVYCRKCYFETRQNEKNYNWKGDNALIKTKHDWVKQKLGTPDCCEHCGKSSSEVGILGWSNKDHKYQRKIEDWQRLCRKCHAKYDKEKGLRFTVKPSLQ